MTRVRSWTSLRRSRRLKKKKHGAVAVLFSSHPMTDDRIQAAQKNIQDNLEARPEYVVNTSEFNDVRAPFGV